MSTPIFDLDITEDYLDLLILRERDVYLMESFVKGGFRSADLKALNFVWKFLQVVSLSDIATADGRRIAHHSYHGFGREWFAQRPGMAEGANKRSDA